MFGQAAPGLTSAKGAPAADALNLGERGRIAPGKRKLETLCRNTERRDQRQILAHDVLRAIWRRRLRVERPGGALPQVPNREAEHTPGPRRAGQHRRFEQPLKVNGDVVALRSKQARDVEPPAERPRAQHDRLVDDGNEIHQLAMLGVDEPIDPCLRRRPPERRGGRQGVDDVAERSQPDDEDAIHVFRSRARRSLVEWSFGSPTIAIRPPYRRTMSRSGTVSTV